VLELSAEQIKPAPELNCAIDAQFITGLGTAKSGDDERMLILMDIQGLMQSAEMGLMDPVVSH
jgi:purine-binding chemotaxis protein CheW